MNKLSMMQLIQDDSIWPLDFITSKKFDLFINSIPDAVIISNEAGNIIHANNQALKLFKYPSDEFKACTIEELVPNKVRDFHAQLRKDFFNDPHPRYLYSRTCLSLSAVNKSGQEFPIESSLFEIETDQGPLAINIMRDISKRVAKENNLKEQAYYDSLTQLPNRAYYQDMLKRLVKRSERTAQLFALLYIDIDKFKAVNDTHGHDTGDQLLRELAQRITHALREGDFTARIGGDEFVAILYALNTHQDGIDTAKRIIKACSKPVIIDNLTIEVSSSIGIVFNDTQEETEHLLLKADRAMYHVKNKQGNDFALYHDLDLE